MHSAKIPKLCNALIGSPNLTSKGFSVNTEAAWVQHGISRAEMDGAFAADARRDNHAHG